MKISKSNIRKAVVIGVFEIVLFTLLYIYSVRFVKQVILKREQTMESYINPDENDIGLTPVDWEIVKKSNPEPVKGGIFLERISDFDIVNSKWSYDFYAWFKWNPGKIDFIDLKDSTKGAISVQNKPVKIVNGTIENISTQDFHINKSGDSAYILFHISGSATKSFDVSLYPLDKYLLMIQLEHVKYDIPQLVFLPDTANSNVSSRVSISGFQEEKSLTISKPHTIKSSLGDPQKKPSQWKTYSQLRYAIPIERGGLTIYLKTFITLYIAAFLGFLSFFAIEGDKKIEVIVGSIFFAAATLNIITTRIPTSEGFSIAELINDISLLTILLIAAKQTVVKYFFRNNQVLDDLSTWVTFSITLIFYVIFNIAIPLICINSFK